METRDKISFVLWVAVAFVAGLATSNSCHQKRPVEPIETKVDTLLIRDTITSYKALYETRRVVDSVLIPVRDTIRTHDTLFVYLEREQVVWRDSLAEVYASGIEPKIDSVRHYKQDRIITIETAVPYKVRSRWGVGLQAGYGVSNAGLTPYIGIGMSYNILSW